MVSQFTKYEISRFTRYEAVNGGAKCRKWGGLGALKVNGNVTIRQSAYDFLFDFNRNYTVSQKKQDTKLLLITSPNVNRFSKFFHW